MPKFPSIPRLSIIVPIGRDLAAFEDTLISVLENQPADSEVLVPHDGTYNDPFDLCGEVRFVDADTKSLVELVAASAAVAQGRFIHVLSDGIRATDGWADIALEKFEHFDAGVVAPVIRSDASGKVIAAGWHDGSDRLCKPACPGRNEVGSRAPKAVGAYLQASFWRRQLIRSLGDAFIGHDTVEATYAYDHLIRSAQWRCVLATECEVLCGHQGLPWDVSSIGRGGRLRAIRNHYCEGGWGNSLIASAGAAVANLLRPGQFAEAIGQAFAPLGATRTAKQNRPKLVAACEEEQTVFARAATDAGPRRRAA